MTRPWLLPLAILIFLAAAAGQAPPDPGPGATHDQLKQVLQDPLYQRWKLRQARNATPTADTADWDFLHKFQQSIKDTWGWIVRKLGFGSRGGRTTPSGAGWSFGSLSSWLTVLQLVGWVALAAVVVVLAMWVYRMVTEARAGPLLARVISREQIRQALDQGEALALAAPDWLNEAERLARQRDPRAVYRALYLAMLSGLHTAGKIDFRRNRTNWVYVSRFKGPDHERVTFSGLTEMFDNVWYGERPAEASRIEGVRREVAGLVGAGGGNE